VKTRGLIICLEGPSAVGKTTVCRYLHQHFGFHVISEVNQCWARPTPEPANWYLDRQLERWALAVAAAAAEQGKTVLLDGDHLQPLWYNWIFTELDLQALDFVGQFYKAAFKVNQCGFADKYILLSASKIQLQHNQNADTQRNRSNFQRHLRLIEPQQRYFHHLNEHNPGLVDSLGVTTVESLALSIVQSIVSVPVAIEQNTLLQLQLKFLSANL